MRPFALGFFIGAAIILAILYYSPQAKTAMRMCTASAEQVITLA